MRPTVYIETTIPSYLTAWPSRDLVRAAHQQVTREWWATRDTYELRVSRIVIAECGKGDAQAAKERLGALSGIELLDPSHEAGELADALLRDVPLPPAARLDALHMAISAVHAMNYLLTWNCRHIANATLRKRIERVCRAAGYEPPLICTPQEFTAGNPDDD